MAYVISEDCIPCLNCIPEIPKKDFGCGETEFHTADIERLIKENKRMVHIIEQSVGVLSLDSTYSEVDKKNTIKQLKHLIELYK